MTALCIGSSDKPDSITRGVGVCPECWHIVPLNGNYGLRRHYPDGNHPKGRGPGRWPRNWNEE